MFALMMLPVNSPLNKIPRGKDMDRLWFDSAPADYLKQQSYLTNALRTGTPLRNSAVAVESSSDRDLIQIS